MSNSAFIEFILMANSGQNTAKTQRREQKKFKLHILGDSKFILKKTIVKKWLCCYGKYPWRIYEI